MTVVYIDSLFALNLIINYLLLLTAAKITGSPAGRIRMLLGALFGALYAIAVWLPGLELMNSLPFKLLSGAAVVAISFAGSRYFLRRTIIFFSVSVALGGCVLAISLLAYGAIPPGGALYLPIDVKTLLLTAGISYALLSLVFRRAGRHSGREMEAVRVEVCGRVTTLTALLDSGHTLTDPMTGLPVLVADGALANRLLGFALPVGAMESPAEKLGELGDRAVRFRLIPYRAVGVECGFLLAFKPSSVRVRGKTYKNILVALSPTPISDGAANNALLGGIAGA